MNKIISVLCVTTMLVNLSGCGTILYPERSGQAKGGRLDLGIVLLDGVGLLCFIIPGVIAYAVDFANGTIYLPRGHAENVDIEDIKTDKMAAIHVGKENLTPARIKSIVSANAGKNVDTANAQVYKLSDSGEKVKIY